MSPFLEIRVGVISGPVTCSFVMKMFGAIANEDPPDSVPQPSVATSHTASPNCSPISAGERERGSCSSGVTASSSADVSSSSSTDVSVFSLLGAAVFVVSLEPPHALIEMRNRKAKREAMFLFFISTNLAKSIFKPIHINLRRLGRRGFLTHSHDRQ